MALQLLRFPDAQAAAEALAGEIAGRLAGGVAARGRASLVVPGGSTPGPLFDALASRRSLDWARVEVALNDERWVAPTDAASNERLVRERLLTGPAASARFVPLYRAGCDAASAVPSIAEDLKGVARPFDVMLLGMGGDGHTASLFPHSPALRASLAGDPAEVQAVREAGARGSAERITLALPALLDSRLIALLIRGEDKLETLARAQAGGDGMELPIRAVIVGARKPVQVYWSP